MSHYAVELPEALLHEAQEVAQAEQISLRLAACLLAEQGYEVVGLFMRVGAKEENVQTSKSPNVQTPKRPKPMGFEI